MEKSAISKSEMTKEILKGNSNITYKAFSEVLAAKYNNTKISSTFFYNMKNGQAKKKKQRKIVTSNDSILSLIAQAKNLIKDVGSKDQAKSLIDALSE